MGQHQSMRSCRTMKHAERYTAAPSISIHTLGTLPAPGDSFPRPPPGRRHQLHARLTELKRRFAGEVGDKRLFKATAVALGVHFPPSCLAMPSASNFSSSSLALASNRSFSAKNFRPWPDSSRYFLIISAFCFDCCFGSGSSGP